MRKKLVWLLAAVMVVSAVMLGGCGGKKVTAESIIQEVNANMEKCKSFTGDMNMDKKMGMSDGTEEQEISITMGGSLEATTDPVITHMDVTMDMLGMSVDMDVYAQVEGEKTTTYTGVMGSWTKTEQETPDTAAMENLYTIAGDGKNMTLAEKTEKIGDREAYVLTSTITGEELAGLMNSMGGDMTQGLGVDLSSMEAVVNMKVYKDKMVPASVSVEMKDNGEGIEIDGIVMKLGMTMVMNYSDFDTIESITIPEEALAAELLDTDAMMAEESELLEEAETGAETETAAE